MPRKGRLAPMSQIVTSGTSSVTPPVNSGIASWYEGSDLVDAYGVAVPHDSTDDVQILAHFLLAQPPLWLSLLMGLRDAIVTPFGIKTSRQLARAPLTDSSKRIEFFKVYSNSKNEIILGENDKHLDFRLSVLRAPTDHSGEGHIIVTTAVRCHNRLGRSYLALIQPFHRIVVRAYLRRAARKGWPKARPIHEASASALTNRDK
jgi:hypothetical protein